jgi:Mrp family chromosome partitioning ATPase
MNALVIYFFPGWIAPVCDSVWLGAVLCVVSVAVIVSLFFLWRRSKKKNPVSLSQKQSSSRSSDIESILSSIRTTNGMTRSILLAAGRRSDLPVTIPVRLAMQLAQKGPCLLIDLDGRRDAVAKVFDVDSSRMHTSLKLSPVPTSFENLSIWPARYFDLLRQMNLRPLLEDADKKYDTILLYAPTLTALADRRQVAACAKQAIVFNGNESKDSPLYLLLTSCRCKILHEA